MYIDIEHYTYIDTAWHMCTKYYLRKHWRLSERDGMPTESDETDWQDVHQEHPMTSTIFHNELVGYGACTCTFVQQHSVYMYNTHSVGTRCYKQPLDFLVWSHCYLQFAYKAPPFYPVEFTAAATAILNQVNMTRENITVNNARAVYLHLCHVMSP